MGEFKEIFKAYGADYQATMTRFMGNETMYMKFLDMMFQDQNLKRLGDALDAGDLKDGFEAAHTLKGVVGNMGLTPLYDAVCLIVEPLRAETRSVDYQALYGAIRDEFQKADKLRCQLKGGGG